MDCNVGDFNTTVHKCRDSVVSIYGKVDEKISFLCNGFYYKLGKILTVYESISKASNIFISISNFNGHGKKKIFCAEIKDYDIISNCAVLELKNVGAPIFHSFLNWGKSRNLNLGEVVFIIGISNDDEENNSIFVVNISNSRFSDKNGIITGELLSFCGTNFKYFGMPVFSMNGKVIGMVNGQNTALSEYFLRFPLIEFSKSQKIKKTLKLVAHPLSVAESVNIMDAKNSDSFIIEGYYIVSNSGKSNLEEGDVLISIEGKKIGTHKGQVNPILELWWFEEDREIKISYLCKNKNYDIVDEKVTPERFDDGIYTI